jgi:hypothetical protein
MKMKLMADAEVRFTSVVERPMELYESRRYSTFRAIQLMLAPGGSPPGKRTIKLVDVRSVMVTGVADVGLSSVTMTLAVEPSVSSRTG